MNISVKLLYSPLVILYAAGPLVHDVLPYLSKIDLRRGAYFAALYFIGFLLLIPFFYFYKKNERRTVTLNPQIVLRFILALSVMLTPYVFLWSDWSLFYISLAIAFCISVSCLIIFRRDIKQENLLKDHSTGLFYRVEHGKVWRLSENEIKDIKLKDSNLLDLAGVFNPSNNPIYERYSEDNATISSTDNYGYSGCQDNAIVNPSSGSPMIGGMSGLDMNGNSWGTNFNEPNNTYDPNRGY